MLHDYVCHKKVKAAKIYSVSQQLNGTTLFLEADYGSGYNVITKPLEWFTKHNPERGGYYVEYEDGYASFSPAKAFESGYALATAVNGESALHAAASRLYLSGRWSCSTLPEHSQISLWQRLRAALGFAPGTGTTAEALGQPGRDELHGIGWAVKQMQNGSLVQRAGWNGKDMYLGITKFPGAMTEPFVFRKTADEKYVPWLCSQTDLLATDWQPFARKTERRASQRRVRAGAGRNNGPGRRKDDA